MKRIAVVMVAGGLMVAPTPVVAQPTQVAVGYYDTQMVKRMVKKAYWNQDSYTRSSLCRKWYSNPSARIFVRLAMVAYRTPGVSMREAAGGVYQAFSEVC